MSMTVAVPPTVHDTAGTTRSALQPVPEDDDALCDEIATLAGHIAAATCRFLVLLGELDARGAWAGAGVRGTGHWLSYRCGMGEVAAREHVRVARALRHLPRTVEAFGAGQISYSKVRAISRVATPENEHDLVDLALSAPANHVERLVRGLRTAQEAADVRDRHARRSLTWRWAEDGSLLLSGRFAPEDGARIVQRAEEEMSGAPPGPEDQHDLVGWCEGDPGVRSRRSLADALLELCTTVPVEDGAPRTSHPAEAVVHVTLAELQEGDTSTGTPCPAPEDVEDVSPGGPRQASPDAAPAPQSLPPATLPGTPRLAGGTRFHPSVARRLACDGGIVLEVHEDGVGVSGRTLEVGAKVRRPRSALVRALLSRDGGCRYPGCARRRFLNAHHVQFWADGGLTVLGNMVLLCGSHHRLLHDGGFTLSMDDHGTVLVRDREGRTVQAVPPTTGTTAGARAVAERGRAVTVTAPGTAPHGTGAAGGARDQDAAIGAWTITGRWDGEPLDVGYATSVLLEGWELDARRRAGTTEPPARPRRPGTPGPPGREEP
ncbi:DUF222 domain-containing protein [Georgenia sp. 10Sc9-8]|uniref:DUF222 domain-containing protein n=1 Tax=Georgenia halotolerans TaxID=3028317 RepID=A0ABT5U068_9MICO|nr:DUF222 domain-containing protein [Georgenia halotolerans]